MKCECIFICHCDCNRKDGKRQKAPEKASFVLDTATFLLVTAIFGLISLQYGNACGKIVGNRKEVQRPCSMCCTILLQSASSARLSVFTISSPRLAAGGVCRAHAVFLGADWRRAGRVRHHAHHPSQDPAPYFHARHTGNYGSTGSNYCWYL